MIDFTANWMNYLDGTKKLHQLTIPGTHDTCTYTTGGLFQCQTMNLEKQFKSGIRFWDIRLKVKGGKIYAYHGTKYLDITIENILTSCSVLLHQFPTECIIMCISHEGNQDNEELYEKLWPIIKDLSYWHTLDHIPTVSEARGKAVLVRRFKTPDGLGFPVGINAYGSWPKNSTERWENNAKVKFAVQDEYKDFSSLKMKNKFEKFVRPLWDEAQNDKERLFINFTSGTVDGGGSLFFPPRSLAEVTNVLLLDYLSKFTSGHYGMIPMDFPEIPQNGRLINRLLTFNPFNFTSAEPLRTGNIYEIRSRLDLNKCLDVKGNIKTDGTQVIVHASKDQMNQRWKLADAGEGYFYIHTLTQNATDSVLDVRGNLQADGTNIIIHKQNNGNNQKWKITKLENGYFVLEPKNAPNSLLDLYESKTEDGSPVKIFKKNYNDWAEQWALLPIK
ncbi:phosphatidylinositol-specific phospholipase C domain-containing protein [Flavobacterium notoginsengisoli]|uniref:phosphatidylinositol-specific phospholipase C domain-containing protein n=1 Tax=Flavobacterium notoginsengisoli TaxID=1478199 RepID=UPI0036377E9C